MISTIITVSLKMLQILKNKYLNNLNNLIEQKSDLSNAISGLVKFAYLHHLFICKHYNDYLNKKLCIKRLIIILIRIIVILFIILRFGLCALIDKKWLRIYLLDATALFGEPRLTDFSFF